MAGKGKGKGDAGRGDAEHPDVAKWGGKSTAGAYAPGTVVDIGGTKVDLSTVPDLIGGEPLPKVKEKPARDRAPRRPS